MATVAMHNAGVCKYFHAAASGVGHIAGMHRFAGFHCWYLLHIRVQQLCISISISIDSVAIVAINGDLVKVLLGLQRHRVNFALVLRCKITKVGGLRVLPAVNHGITSTHLALASPLY